jgi:hypothetical protein
MIRIAILSLEEDLHAHAILRSLHERGGVKCHFVATDTLHGSGGLRWWQGSAHKHELLSYDGTWFDVGDLDLIWWRRVNQAQKYCGIALDDVEKSLIDNEWRSALSGLIYDGFRGVWINEPFRDGIAGNKLYQLNVAAAAGLRVPRTLISQDPSAIREFCNELGGSVILKKLVGASPRPLATVLVSSSDLTDDASIRLCPAIYQELVQGSRHLRVNCFGNRIHAIAIDSPWLDWRRDLTVPFSFFQLDSQTETTLSGLLQRLGIRMGIMDLKFDQFGDLVWLELNTQGQFLFAEGLSKHDLINPFTDFLIDETRLADQLRKSG